MIIVWPAKDLVGMGSLVRSWDLRYCLILGQVISAILGDLGRGFFCLLEFRFAIILRRVFL